jgi:uncharacterized BrkB/YihY/UPF0761 family membrane protein
MGKDDVSNMAASIAYYAVLSLFPLLLGLLAIFGVFLPSQAVQQQFINFLGQYLPGSPGIFKQLSDIIHFAPRSHRGYPGTAQVSTGYSALNPRHFRAWILNIIILLFQKPA